MTEINNQKSNLVLAYILLTINATAFAQVDAPNSKDLERTVLYHDSVFWQAYNQCDLEGMARFFTEDLEFYHDKAGLTVTKDKLMENVRSGLCGKSDWRLRRQAIPETLKVFPLNGYGAILSGEHVFYIVEPGKGERLDGLAKFTHVWRHQDGAWKMHRILSYDHGPATYRNLRTEISQPRKLMKQYEGTYESPKKSTIIVSLDKDRLVLHTTTSRTTLYASSPDTFFLKERDLQFQFSKGNDGDVTVTVRENGVAVDEFVKVR